VPAQFSALNRWWAKDNSVKHLLVQFNGTVDAYSSPGSGISNYRLTNGSNPAPSDPIQVLEEDAITVSNDKMQLVITQSPFAINTPAGPLEAVFKTNSDVIAPTFERNDITVEVEERGPIRAVIRMSAPTLTLDNGSIQHGWAMRLYAYADSAHVKLDVIPDPCTLTRSRFDCPAAPIRARRSVEHY